MSAFNCFIHRLVTIPLSKENFTDELNIIKQIAINNGYNVNIIDRLLENKTKTLVLKNFYAVQPNSNNKYFTRFNFVGKINRDIKKNFRDTNIKPAYYNNNTLSKLINNKIYTKNALDKSGVYEIQCDNCEYKYIGQTGRSFLIRFNEHMRYWKNKIRF